MKKGQTKQQFYQLKKGDKAKNMRLAQVINIITKGSIPTRLAQKFIQQANNQFAGHTEIYSYLQMPEWKQLKFEHLSLIIEQMKKSLKKAKIPTEVKDNLQIDTKKMRTLQGQKPQNNTLQLIVTQMNKKQTSNVASTARGEEVQYQEKWKQSKFKLIKKLLVIFDFIRKSMHIEGESFEANRKISEKIDLNLFMRYAKMFDLTSVFKPQKIIKSFKDNAINQLWADFDRFVNTNLQMIGFQQTIVSKEKHLRLRGLSVLLSASKIKQMLNIRNNSAFATIVQSYTGTYRQDILDYLKQKSDERKYKENKKVSSKKINKQASERNAAIVEKDNLNNNASKNSSQKSLSKRAKTSQSVSIKYDFKLPKVSALKESRDQNIYKSLKLLDLKNQESKVRELVNTQQDQQYLREYLKKEQTPKQPSSKKTKKAFELPRMKFT